MPLDDDSAYRAVQSRDARFDGAFFTCVRTTRIYCRPSCPARTPLRANVAFATSAGAAQRAGYRACKRCRPDATPGSAEWDVRADLVGRAVRLIADGVVDREGVGGLARRLGYSERQISRAVAEATGAPPLALARARRAQAARTLLESTSMPITDIAYAAGFSSVRQFNDTIVEVYATNPSGLRRHKSPAGGSGLISLRLPYRQPMDLRATLRFLAAHRIDGVEDAVHGPEGWEYTRTLRLPHGPGVVTVRQGIERGTAHVRADLDLTDNRDVIAAVSRIRRWLDLDADPAAVAETLSTQKILRPMLARHPGLRSPGTPDGFELLARTIVGQQVSLASARRVLSEITRRHGDPVSASGRDLLLFPSAETMAEVDPATLPMTRARGRSLVNAAAAVAGGLALDGGADRVRTRRALLALPGVGPWTADYVGMRALSDPDVFLAGDLAVARAVEKSTGLDPDAAAPWRSYLTHYLWSDHPALRVPEEATA